MLAVGNEVVVMASVGVDVGATSHVVVNEPALPLLSVAVTVTVYVPAPE